MKVITEALVRVELKATEPQVYYIPEGKILSPAAREYLQQRKIDIDFEKNRGKREAKAKLETEAVNSKTVDSKEAKPAENNAGLKPKYVDYETGAGYMEKPEHMTQLFGNMLVDKNHPRIKYRGKLDRVQGEVVFAQAQIQAVEKNEALIKDLNNILDILREMMRCEVLDEEFVNETIIGLNHAELRERSHNPIKFFKIKQMLLPDYSMGMAYTLLNLIRTSIRETEVLAVDAFKEKRKLERTDIIEELNRLSSALHIMMCMYLAGEYDSK